MSLGHRAQPQKGVMVDTASSQDVASVSGLLGAPLHLPQSKKYTIVILRWLLVVGAGYVMLFSGSGGSSLRVDAIVVVMLATNVVVSRLPDTIVGQRGFEVLLLLVDTGLLSAGFWLTGSISSDFYFLYFFVIFMAGVSEKLTFVLMGSLLASLAYISVAWVGHYGTAALAPSSLLLRLFFIFGVALLYGVLVERVRVDKERRRTEYVTQLEKVNSRLRELVELKEAFVNGVSHELRTPLNGLLGYLSLVLDGTVGTVKGRVRTYVDRAYSQGLDLLRLIEELLTFVSLSRSRTEVRLAETNINDVLDAVREVCWPSAVVKGLDLRFDVAPDVGCLIADRTKLRDILLHLVSNAVKFTDCGGVQVSATWGPGTLTNGWQGMILECAVRDTGPGIPPALQEVIFEEFRQLDGSLSRRRGGVGLGLPVCRGLVQLLHGEIRVASKLGEGTTFTVRLPADHNLPVVATAQDAASPLIVARG
jgi:signal transduction histidine kinase